MRERRKREVHTDEEGFVHQHIFVRANLFVVCTVFGLRAEIKVVCQWSILHIYEKKTTKKTNEGKEKETKKERKREKKKKKRVKPLRRLGTLARLLV